MLLNDKIGIECQLSDINIIRKIQPDNSDKKPLIIVGFTSWLMKCEVLARTKHLKGASISITEDFPRDVRETTLSQNDGS